MSDIDDTLDDFGEALLEAATQAEARYTQDPFDDSPRPAKRQRLSRYQVDGNGSDDEIEDDIEDDYESDEPPVRSNHFQSKRNGQRKNVISSEDGEDVFEPPQPAKKGSRRPSRTVFQNEEADGDQENQKSAEKPKHRMHVPDRDLDLRDVFLTQPPPASSNPWMIRGPIWQKKKPEALAEVPPVQSLPKKAPVEKPTHFPPKNTAAERPRAAADAGVPFGPPAIPRQSTGKTVKQAIAASAQQSHVTFDVDDELADLPSDAFSSSQPSQTPARQQRLAAPLNGLRQTTLFGRDGAAVPPSQANKRHNWPMADQQEPRTHHKIDEEAMETWIYPTNLGTIRDYQFNIVMRGLFHNLLVALPTGLGKTFIAATIILNWYRWTKEAQIVFVAPTKPLVAQQVEACFGIAGIPRSQTTMLTGEVKPALRAEEWGEKRVFFMTPQTLIRDLSSGIADPKKIVLIVVDEAHRATGNYAYVEVVKFIRRFNESFRVLALTATPGADVEAVQKVIDGLDISRVEIRTENSLDIRQYVHQRKVDTQVFNYSDEMEHIMDLFSKAVSPVLNVLSTQNAYWIKDPLALTPFGLTKARQAWMASEAGRKAPQWLKGMVNTVFTVLASLSHGIELLKYHGIGPFYHNMMRFRNETQGTSKSKYRKEINESEHFNKMMTTIHGWINKEDFIGHPKLEYLRDVVLAHFTGASEAQSGIGPHGTRIIVFAHFRDSAEQIVRVLGRLGDMVRPRVFVGQATSNESEGMDQKKQLDVLDKFKNGVYNTLVATSIGEEGLDIGEVDLIICYDSKASPIRMLQRMGRTGRKRAGKIILLQMSGKEESDAAKAKDSYEKMQAMIATGDHFNFHHDRSRRIVPKEIQPVVDKREVEIPWENTQAANGDHSFLPVPTGRKGKRGKKTPPKKFHMPDGVRTGFTTASRLNGDDDDEDVPPKTKGKRRAPNGKLNNVIELQPIPALQDVFLTSAEEEELNRQYLQIGDEEDELFIGKPSLTSRPQAQRKLRKTKYVEHGQRAKAMVQMLNRMHDMDEARVERFKESVPALDQEDDFNFATVVDDWLSTSVSREVEEVPNKRAPPRCKQPAKKKQCRATNFNEDDAEEGASSSPPPASARWQIRSQAVDLGSQDTSGEEAEEGEGLDSDLDDFIVDDEEPIQLLSSPRPSQETPYRLSQLMKSTQDDEDLPDISTLVQRAATQQTATQKTTSAASKGVVDAASHRGRRRRVVDDSSSE